MPESMQIDGVSVVNDVVRCHPDSLSVFSYFGVDTCCRGAVTISEAAEHAFVDADALIDALRGSARQAGRTQSLLDADHVAGACCRSKLPVKIAGRTAVGSTASITGNAPPD